MFGKTAEAVGDDCCLCCCAYISPFNFIARLHVRERIRQKKDLKVSHFLLFIIIIVVVVVVVFSCLCRAPMLLIFA